MNQFQLELSSPVIEEGEAIPPLYTCKGRNINPPLTISGVPEEAESLALLLHDPDAPNGDFLHWSVWNMDPRYTAVIENLAPAGAIEGTNDFGSVGYGGPCPPSGTHHYEFILYALDPKLDLLPGASRYDVEAGINQHKIAQASLIATFASN